MRENVEAAKGRRRKDLRLWKSTSNFTYHIDRLPTLHICIIVGSTFGYDVEWFMLCDMIYYTNSLNIFRCTNRFPYKNFLLNWTHISLHQHNMNYEFVYAFLHLANAHSSTYINYNCLYSRPSFLSFCLDFLWIVNALSVYAFPSEFELYLRRWHSQSIFHYIAQRYYKNKLRLWWRPRPFLHFLHARNDSKTFQN